MPQNVKMVPWWVKKGVSNPLLNPTVIERTRQLNIGRSAWNKGLTKKTDERVLGYSLKLKGLTKSPSTKKKLSLARKGKPLNPKQMRAILKAGKIGRKKILKLRKGKTYEEFYGEEKALRIKKKLKTRVPWSKGLCIWEDRPHPRGMLGKTHTEENKHKFRIQTFARLQSQISDGLPISPLIGKNETEMLDQIAYEYETVIQRQYEVLGYYLDGYSKKYNIAFEVDEKNHKWGKAKKRDVIRRQRISDELSCEFVIIEDY